MCLRVACLPPWQRAPSSASFLLFPLLTQTLPTSQGAGGSGDRGSTSSQPQGQLCWMAAGHPKGKRGHFRGSPQGRASRVSQRANLKRGEGARPPSPGRVLSLPFVHRNPLILHQAARLLKAQELLVEGKTQSSAPSNWPSVTGVSLSFLTPQYYFNEWEFSLNDFFVIILSGGMQRQAPTLPGLLAGHRPPWVPVFVGLVWFSLEGLKVLRH